MVPSAPSAGNERLPIFRRKSDENLVARDPPAASPQAVKSQGFGQAQPRALALPSLVLLIAGSECAFPC